MQALTRDVYFRIPVTTGCSDTGLKKLESSGLQDVSAALLSRLEKDTYVLRVNRLRPHPHCAEEISCYVDCI